LRRLDDVIQGSASVRFASHIAVTFGTATSSSRGRRLCLRFEEFSYRFS
jgi:hypothetical protein